MGDLNQLIFAKKALKNFKGRVLEIGSKNYGSTQNFRDLFPDNEYIGVDLESGPNVDLVHNIENGLGPLESQKFDLIIICSVLEHTPTPWILANNIQKLMTQTSAVYSCHPWVWRYHKYPDDYFRFSPKGIQSLFSGLNFWLPEYYATYKQGEFLPFSKNDGIDNDFAIFDAHGRKFLPYLQTIMLGSNSEDLMKIFIENLYSSVSSPKR
jgi:hypothetical protein